MTIASHARSEANYTTYSFMEQVSAPKRPYDAVAKNDLTVILCIRAATGTAQYLVRGRKCRGGTEYTVLMDHCLTKNWHERWTVKVCNINRMDGTFIFSTILLLIVLGSNGVVVITCRSQYVNSSSDKVPGSIPGSNNDFCPAV